jgi:hypothetical protein
MGRLLSRAKIIGRWIVLVPVCVLAAVITPVAVELLVRLTPWELDPYSFMGHFGTKTAAGTLSGLVFVYVGVAIAPDKHRAVAIAWRDACVTLGACLAAVSIADGEVKLGST